jgi:hypothetical protein
MATIGSREAIDWVTVGLSVIGTATTLLVGFGVYWLTRKSNVKSLTYDFSSVQIGGFEKSFDHDLQINFRGQPVEDVSLVTITFRNPSKVPIQRSDFDERLEISAPTRRVLRRLPSDTGTTLARRETSILAVQTSSASPRDLPVSVHLDLKSRDHETNIYVDPLLLNAGDEFTLVTLIRGFGDRLMVTGRIVGVNKIEYRQPARRPMTFIDMLIFASVFSVSIFMLAQALNPHLRSIIDNWGTRTPPTFLALLSIATLIFGIQIVRRR